MIDFLWFEKNIDALSASSTSSKCKKSDKMMGDILVEIKYVFDQEFFQQNFSTYRIPDWDPKRELRNISKN